MSSSDRAHRGTLFVEDAVVRDVRSFPADQYVLAIEAPRAAAAAVPGSFVHVRCSDSIPMRRPLSIMRADPGQGRIEVLFKVVGDGLEALGARRPGDVVSSIGPIGRGFSPGRERRRPILIGGGVGIPPMIFLAERLKAEPERWQPAAFFGSEIPFPFDRAPSSLPVAGAGEATSAMALLESWSVPSRLASLSDFDGCQRGFVTDLADRHLATLDGDALAEVEIFACGPTPMLEATARLAARYGVPCQVSLEEYMACAVGGCAGCTVPVRTPSGTAMLRVCVDGPVFAADSVFPLR